MKVKVTVVAMNRNKMMKESNIVWLGKIPDSWKVEKNKHLFSCSKTLVGDKSSQMQLLSLTTQGIKKKSADDKGGKVPESYDTYQYVRERQLVMCLFDLDCSAVFSGLSPCEGMISPAYKVLTCETEIIPEYAAYWFQFIFDGRKFMHYSKNLRYTLTYDDFSELPIVLPPFEQQQMIVQFLNDSCDSIDNVVEKTRVSIEEYKALKQSIIAEAVTKGIRPNRKMKESGVAWIGEMPEEWETVNPKALFALRKDKAQLGERQLTASQQFGVIYQDEYMEMTGNKVVTVDKDFDILKHVECGDFVISMRSFQGGIEYSTKAGSISSAYVMLIPNTKKVFPRFYRWLLKSAVYIDALQATTNMVRDGQAMRYSHFAKVRLMTLPLNEQEEIADHLDYHCSIIDSIIVKKEEYVKQLESYKKALIYEYVTGKKGVQS